MQVFLMPRSRMVEMPRFVAMTQEWLQVKSRFVMPVSAGVHLHSLQEGNTKMDSGLRRNDRSEPRLLAGANRNARFRGESRSTRLQGST
jgi:hypothetical protein